MTMAIYALGYFILKWQTDYKKWGYLFPVMLSLIVLWKLKYYVPITLLPILILTLLFSRQGFLPTLQFSKKLILYLVFLIVGGLALAFIHPVFSSGRFFELIRISHDVIVINSSEAIIQFQNTESNILFFTQNLPLAWFTGIFRPFFWESFNAFSLLWTIEKGIFTLLAIYAIFLSIKLRFTPTEKWWGIAIIVYASVLSSIITLATPNFGTLIRYEVAYMPFLWLMVLWVLNKYKLQKTS
jgi:hypothetical protein